MQTVGGVVTADPLAQFGITPELAPTVEQLRAAYAELQEAQRRASMCAAALLEARDAETAAAQKVDRAQALLRQAVTQ